MNDSAAAMTASHLEGRIDSLDRRLSDTSSKIFDKIEALVNVVNQLSLSVQNAQTLAQNAKPPSLWAVIGAAGATAALVGSLGTGLFFLIDARVGAKTERASAFVEEMTRNGKLYVELDRLDRRIERMENAIDWRPSIERTN